MELTFRHILSAILMTAVITGCMTSNGEKTSCEVITEEDGGMYVSGKWISRGNLKRVVFQTKDSSVYVPDTMNLGKMNEGETAIVDFIVRNDSDSEPLEIARIFTGCGCTTANWQKDEIKPGADRVVKLFFNSNGQYGKQFKTITVVSARGEEHEIYMMADVKY